PCSSSCSSGAKRLGKAIQSRWQPAKLCFYPDRPSDTRPTWHMISDLDIWRAANLLIRQHGADAEIEAARKVDLMLERGDHDGQLVWMRIARAVAALTAPSA